MCLGQVVFRHTICNAVREGKFQLYKREIAMLRFYESCKRTMSRHIYIHDCADARLTCIAVCEVMHLSISSGRARLCDTYHIYNPRYSLPVPLMLAEMLDPSSSHKLSPKSPMSFASQNAPTSAALPASSSLNWRPWSCQRLELVSTKYTSQDSHGTYRVSPAAKRWPSYQSHGRHASLRKPAILPPILGVHPVSE